MASQEKIVLNRNQLIEFAKQIYAIGATGYLDLMESTCEQAVENLISSNNTIKSTPSETKNPYYDMFQCVVSNFENFEDMRGDNSNNTVSNLVYTPALYEEESYMRRMALQENFNGNNSERI